MLCKSFFVIFFILAIVVLIRINGVMASVIASSVVDRGFKPRSVQTKNYKISIFFFSAKHVSSRRKSKDWLARNQYNVSEYCCKHVDVVQSGSRHHLIEN